jgi:hypothetical protein
MLIREGAFIIKTVSEKLSSIFMAVPANVQ